MMQVRSGVVKFAASGASVRSTIERSPIVSLWLDQNAEQIQILVMQNFLFFGNASLLNSYVVGMFADAAYDLDPLLEAPSPKIIIVDLALVTGMDTSAVDVFSDILSTCVKNDCKLFMSGVSPRVQKVMYLCGVRPDSILCRSQRRLRFFSCLDAALGKAEDLLIQLGGFEEDIYDAGVVDGFLRSLNQIDMQHNIAFSNDLHALQAYTRPVLLNPGDCLHEKNDGLFFIEQGILVRTDILNLYRNLNLSLARIYSRTFSRKLKGVQRQRYLGLAVRLYTADRMSSQSQAFV